MSFKMPQKASVLLCPKGLKFGTIGTDRLSHYQRVEAAGQGVIFSLTKQSFANWLCNVKELTTRVTTTVHYPGGEFPDSITTGTQVTVQYIADESTSITTEQNTGPAPLPINTGAASGLGLLDLHSFSGGGSPFTYHFAAGNTSGGPLPAFFESLYIHADGFFAFVYTQNDEDYTTSATLTDTKLTFDSFQPGDYIEITTKVEYEITQKYYN